VVCPKSFVLFLTWAVSINVDVFTPASLRNVEVTFIAVLLTITGAHRIVQIGARSRASNVPRSAPLLEIFAVTLPQMFDVDVFVVTSDGPLELTVVVVRDFIRPTHRLRAGEVFRACWAADVSLTAPILIHSALSFVPNVDVFAVATDGPLELTQVGVGVAVRSAQRLLLKSQIKSISSGFPGFLTISNGIPIWLYLWVSKELDLSKYIKNTQTHIIGAGFRTS